MLLSKDELKEEINDIIDNLLEKLNEFGETDVIETTVQTLVALVIEQKKEYHNSLKKD